MNRGVIVLYYTEKKDTVFALDIGTHSVVGLILHRKEDGYHVIDVERLEHDERSMLDGQIHNVMAVSRVIQQVKQALEEKHGPLHKVCVAAAGRSLKTQREKAEIDILGKPIFDKQSILHLELSAVQKAQFALAHSLSDEQKKVNDYCVGYSVIDYRLDDEPIGSLMDQRGEKASVEVIATFLPKVVVESLISALKRADLELEALTLEPIAAINVLIPPSMRRLNVALVDIGAGTSDIAITDLGTVTAYGMVPVAGDEITEAISDQYLLDFPDAEKLKRELTVKEKVSFTDILGFETEYEKSEVIQEIESSVHRLADRISQEILALNNKAPKAVMLVGGGSLTPKLTEILANKLSLPANRVAIRDINAIKDLKIDTDCAESPELVTPIGIAIAAKESPVEYVSVKVNNQDIRLFDIKQLTIGDALLSSGLELSKLYGKPGMAMMVNVNGRVISVPGEHGTPPKIERNGEPSQLDEPLHHNDDIYVEKGKNGADATAYVKDFIEDTNNLSLLINEENIEIPPVIRVNGEISEINREVNDRDQIEHHLPKTVDELFSTINKDADIFATKTWKLFIDREEVTISKSGGELFLNGKLATLETVINHGDHLEYVDSKDNTLHLKEVFEKYDRTLSKEIVVTFNEHPVKLEKPLFEVYRKSEKLTEQSAVYSGDELKVSEKENVSFIFQDIFAKVNVERPIEKNKKPVILRNDEDTTFSSPIFHGDSLILKWVDTY